ncbi:Helix-hairpin-helix motif-containing protein [Desulfonema limicola]|uniref:Helix-hairpin-helix motif-containing protein n=1 Tax=Desulfonema limicola TaxID=45656 RepID=A0A975B7M7_9BACT|nr:helix-hairpin-helix domain-containing protein [Desulfonema limicola]QTA80153.1 Helix-hairpin-helix motif-containing protein [Desulfonema limicola]
MTIKLLSTEKRAFILFYLVTILLFLPKTAKSDNCLGWTDTAVKLLPDSSFALIEINPDETAGKKIIRHCPYQDPKGKIDYEQLIYEIGSFNKEVWFNEENKETALKQLKIHYDDFIKNPANKNALDELININTAPLTKLVFLPRIGPVLAVKIACYRKTHPPFNSIEDIKQIEGIGQGTFNAVRHYISVR